MSLSSSVLANTAAGDVARVTPSAGGAWTGHKELPRNGTMEGCGCGAAPSSASGLYIPTSCVATCADSDGTMCRGGHVAGQSSAAGHD
eukprot:CAMPEP_0170351024 /NCGR_PEP_ID=MMETSP0116_2-20130129/76810_1 /TAXON_ID=400756 /ORGANISM="Durinskia baltica, Strain CSIRO CS-38" /LENGTH=87 /DNA_ID=CAMNT_0010604923 /DNA_START=423 /DNA_END=686 /DNA_ORIENTATION=+